MNKDDTKPDNNLIRLLNIKNKESNTRPYSIVDKSIINMQLEIAKIIIKDAYAIQMKCPEMDFASIVNELTTTWRDNIKNFVLALIIKGD